MEQNKTKKPYEPADILSIEFAMGDVLAFSTGGGNDNFGSDLEGGWGL